MKIEPNDPKWVQDAKRNEERNEAMNYMNSAHKATNEAYRDGYDNIQWDTHTTNPIAQLEW